MAKPDSKWYRLDNAGILYSALQKEEYSAIYRFSALMERDVDPAALQRAIDRCMPRFPSFAVRIRKGAFWYYLEPNTAPGPFLKEDVSDPCQPVRFKEDNGWLVRFYYYRSRISIEVFHALSDGGGAIVFFRTLLAEYLRQTGVDVPPGTACSTFPSRRARRSWRTPTPATRGIMRWDCTASRRRIRIPERRSRSIPSM